MENIKETLKDKLNESILLYGLADLKTIELSQRLDPYIAMEQSEYYGIN